jgi:hypothetical protein
MLSQIPKPVQQDSLMGHPVSTYLAVLNTDPVDIASPI